MEIQLYYARFLYDLLKFLEIFHQIQCKRYGKGTKPFLVAFLWFKRQPFLPRSSNSLGSTHLLTFFRIKSQNRILSFFRIVFKLTTPLKSINFCEFWAPILRCHKILICEKAGWSAWLPWPLGWVLSLEIMFKNWSSQSSVAWAIRIQGIISIRPNPRIRFRIRYSTESS